MKLELTVDGTVHPIDVPADAAGSDIALCQPGVYSVIVDGRACEAKVEHVQNGLSIVVIGPHRFEVEIRDPRRYLGASRSRAAAGLANVAAPMPGKVVRVLVVQGEAVEAGQGIAVVEAMKMQNEIKAQRSGKVISLSAKEGAAVAAGQVLAVIE